MREGEKSKLGKERVEPSDEFYLYVAYEKWGRKIYFMIRDQDCELKSIVAIPGYGTAL